LYPNEYLIFYHYFGVYAHLGSNFIGADKKISGRYPFGIVLKLYKKYVF